MPAPASAATTTATTGTGRGRRGRGRAGVTPVPLGSLTQREHRAVISCRGCGSTRVTRLSLNLTDGTPVDFTSCHRCEHRTWEEQADSSAVAAVLPVQRVLDKTRKR